MLRKCLGSVLGLVLFTGVLLNAAPANAEVTSTGLGIVCHNFTSGNGLKKVHVCVSVDEHVYPSGSGMHEGYGQVSATNIGTNDAYSVFVDPLVVLSATTPNAGTFCDGDTPACTGGGDLYGSTNIIPFTVTTDPNITTHCYVHSQVVVWITWTKGNGSTLEPVFTSNEVAMTAPCGP